MPGGPGARSPGHRWVQKPGDRGRFPSWYTEETRPIGGALTPLVRVWVSGTSAYGKHIDEGDARRFASMRDAKEFFDGRKRAEAAEERVIALLTRKAAPDGPGA